MKEEKKIQQSDIDEAKVKLKSMAGVSPLVYLPVLYVFAALLLFFLIFLYPGIRNPGSWLAFDGNPSTCAVYLDGNYKGSTARKFFVKSGSYEMRVEKDGYATSTRKVEIRGRLFASFFFPRVTRFDYDLAALDGARNLASAYADYASWSLTGQPSALYQVPVLLSEATGDYFRALRNPGTDKAALPYTASDFVSGVAAATQSSELARDGLRASVLVASKGSPSPVGMLSAARTILGVVGRDASGGIWLKDVLVKPGKKTGSLLRKLPAQIAPASSGPVPSPRGFKGLGPQEYLMFSEGWAAMGGEAPSGTLIPYSRKMPSFGLARTETTKSQWSSFLAADAQWRPENKAALMAKGLVDDNYLAGWSSASGDEPVTGVSWYAASAYCAWLSETSGSYAVILPTEAMWETAAAAGLSDPSSIKEKKAVWAHKEAMGPARVASLGYSKIGLADIFGNVWEWSGDSYLPYPALAENAAAGVVGSAVSGALVGPERTVRGGSWANSADKIDLHSRGGLPPSHSSSFLGFRTAIVQR
jgi:hypothetical protein